jgi:hypothetical protein
MHTRPRHVERPDLGNFEVVGYYAVSGRMLMLVIWHTRRLQNGYCFAANVE